MPSRYARVVIVSILWMCPVLDTRAAPVEAVVPRVWTPRRSVALGPVLALQSQSGLDVTGGGGLRLTAWSSADWGWSVEALELASQRTTLARLTQRELRGWVRMEAPSTLAGVGVERSLGDLQLAAGSRIASAQWLGRIRVGGARSSEGWGPWVSGSLGTRWHHGGGRVAVDVLWTWSWARTRQLVDTRTLDLDSVQSGLELAIPLRRGGLP